MFGGIIHKRMLSKTQGYSLLEPVRDSLPGTSHSIAGCSVGPKYVKAHSRKSRPPIRKWATGNPPNPATKRARAIGGKSSRILN